MQKTKWLGRLAVVAILTLAAAAARADVKPNALFSDNMVLQQGMKLPVWGTAANGERVTVTFGSQTVTTTAEDGRWTLTLAPLTPGGPAELTIAGENTIRVANVLVGEVWVCSGQSNMAFKVDSAHSAQEAIAGSANSKIRLFTVPRLAADEPLRDVDGAWSECGPETVGGFSAVGYFFGRHLQEKLDVPVGLINSSYGGTPAEAWTSRAMLGSHPRTEGILDQFAEALQRYPEAVRRYEAALEKAKREAAAARKAGKKPRRRRIQPPMGPEHPKRPGGLYCGMIGPLQPFAIRGAIWYQGEANAARAYQYRTLFPAMIRCWREDWAQGDFPFLFVQLASFKAIVDEPAESDWAELREAQLMTMLNLPNAAMAVITDVGEENNIHPKKKQPVGERLALAARALAYGEDLEYSGPIYKSMKVDDGKVTLRFDHLGGGLVAEGGELTGFAICGEDRSFVNANAKIDGRTVVVSSDQVARPVAVRYGWADYPLGNLWNRAGLPASPFRTDEFPGLTQGED